MARSPACFGGSVLRDRPGSHAAWRAIVGLLPVLAARAVAWPGHGPRSCHHRGAGLGECGWRRLYLAHHAAADGGTTASFQGLGVYRARGDSVSGTWHDSRGISFSVSGRCTDGVFSSRWSGVERGLTVYSRRGDSLVVIDSVFPPTGAAREFGRSVLTRRAIDRSGGGAGVGAVLRE